MHIPLFIMLSIDYMYHSSQHKSHMHAHGCPRAACHEHANDFDADCCGTCSQQTKRLEYDLTRVADFIRVRMEHRHNNVRLEQQ